MGAEVVGRPLRFEQGDDSPGACGGGLVPTGCDFGVDDRQAHTGVGAGFRPDGEMRDPVPVVYQSVRTLALASARATRPVNPPFASAQCSASM